MHIHVLGAGTHQPAWVRTACSEYVKRLPAECRLEITDIRLGARPKQGDVARAVAEEGARMLAAVPAGARVIALDVRGKAFSTESLAHRLQAWLQDGRDLALFIGGPDGLAPACLKRAELVWSLSLLTLPHGLVRVMVTEQIYRAWTILQGHPYHRA